MSELPDVSSVDGLDSPTDVDASVESFERFAQREFRPLIGLAYALCGDRSVAPELAQEALLATCTKWETVRHLDKPEAWVRRVLINRATSTVRRRIVEAARWYA